ncbi:MAG: PIN domain-containing protein [Bacteroidota bacterium]
MSLPKIRYARDKLYASIEFIDDQIIPFEEYILAMRMVRDIDPDDVTFVALNNYMNETLWTGDNQLYKGLKAKGYTRVVNFKDLKKLYNLG